MSEETDRLRLQLERDLDRFEKAGMDDHVAKVQERLAELPEEDEEEEEEEAEVEAEEDFGTGKYEDRTVAQLKALAESKGLPTSGSKADLIDTLREG